MNKEQFVRAVAIDAGLTQKDVNKFLVSQEKVFTEALKNAEEVKLTGFMTIRPVAKAARVGRNPSQNEPIRIPEKVDAFIMPGTRLKNATSALKYEDFTK